MIIYTNYDYDSYLPEAFSELQEKKSADEISDDEVNELAQNLCDDDWFEYYRVILDRYFDSHWCVCIGSLGLWDGTRYGGALIKNHNDFYDLLKDCGYLEISETDNMLNVKCSHHDGTNYYSVRELTDSGKNVLWDSGDGYETIHSLFHSLEYSQQPQIEWCL